MAKYRTQIPRYARIMGLVPALTKCTAGQS